jgi:hypothetical protein
MKIIQINNRIALNPDFIKAVVEEEYQDGTKIAAIYMKDFVEDLEEKYISKFDFNRTVKIINGEIPYEEKEKEKAF